MLVIFQAVLVAGLGSSMCLAEDQKAQSGDTKQDSKGTRRMDTRSLKPPTAAMPQMERSISSKNKGDGGKPDDTIGGLPGAKQDVPDKQP
jgi:hypothetical protein